MSQTSYAVDMSPAAAGMVADSGVMDVMTGENVAEAIPFGLFVSRDTAGDHRIKLPAAAADITDVKKARGVAMNQQAIESSASGDPQYPIKSAVPVLKKGRIWVKVEEAVAPTDTVSIRHAAGGNGVGSFCKTADGSRALLAGAKYLTTAAANGLAVVEMDL